ncbi:MAG: flippase [Chloroflexota bacterium]|nr:flippase [Chloroflexota bacterium]
MTGQLIGFVVLVIVARRVGPENIGAYTLAANLVFYFQIVIDLGVTAVGMRELAKAPHKVREITGEVLALQLAVLVACLAVLLALSPFAVPGERTRALIPILAAGLIPQVLSLGWALQALQSLGSVALLRFLGQAVYGVLAPLLVVGGFPGVKTYAWLNVLGLAVSGFGASVLVWRRHGAPALSMDLRRLLHRYSRGMTIGASLLMVNVYYSADSIMLGYLRGQEAVGQYGVAYKIPLNIITLAGVWFAAFYPYAAELFGRDRDLLRRQVAQVANIAVTLAVPLGIGVTLIGRELMVALFGAAFSAAGLPFVLLTWSAAVVFVQASFGHALLAVGDDRRYLVGVACAAVLNVALNFVLIPPFGPTGAAVATIAAELTVMAYMFTRFQAVLGRISLEWDRAARAAAATVLMALLVAVVQTRSGVLVSMAVGMLAYAGLAFLLGVVRKDEIAVLLLRKRPEASAPDVPG